MRARAKARQGERTDLKGKNIRVNLPEGSDNIVPFPADSAQVRDEIAKAAGVSPKTASDAMTVKERGRPEDWQDVVSGKASIFAAAGCTPLPAGWGSPVVVRATTGEPIPPRSELGALREVPVGGRPEAHAEEGGGPTRHGRDP